MIKAYVDITHITTNDILSMLNIGEAAITVDLEILARSRLKLSTFSF